MYNVQHREIGLKEMIHSVSSMSNESNYDLGIVQSYFKYDGFLLCTGEGHNSPYSNLRMCLHYHTCISQFLIWPLCLCECSLVVKTVYCG